MVSRGVKPLATVFAFFQSIVFVLVIRTVLTNLDQPFIVMGYAAGFATGLVVGMLLESRLAIGYTHLRIISKSRGAEICEHLRESGYAVTEVAGRGKDGTVTMLYCNVLRRHTQSGNSNRVQPRSGIIHHRRTFALSTPRLLASLTAGWVVYCMVLSQILPAGEHIFQNR